MKKFSFVLLILSVLLVLSCASGGKVTDEQFAKIYDKYYSNLILEGAQKYTVKGGDRLAEISRSFYTDGYYYPLIMLASKDVVSDPDKIQPGMELTIPDLQKNMGDAKAKASIKGVILDCARIEDKRERKDTAKGLRDHAAKI